MYFVAGGDRIKIGLTGDLKRRLDDLRMCSPLPLDVLVTIPGDLNVEQYLHRRFAALRSHGEWFRAENPLLSFITDLKRAETPKGVGGRVGENAA